MTIKEKSSRSSASAASPREQLRDQPAGKHPGDAPAVVAGRERRLHRHDLVAHELVKPLEHARVERPAGEGDRAHEQHRLRIGAGEGDAQVSEPLPPPPAGPPATPVTGYSIERRMRILS